MGTHTQLTCTMTVKSFQINHSFNLTMGKSHIKGRTWKLHREKWQAWTQTLLLLWGDCDNCVCIYPVNRMYTLTVSSGPANANKFKLMCKTPFITPLFVLQQSTLTNAEMSNYDYFFNNITIPTKHMILNPAANGAWFIGKYNYYVQYVQSAAFQQPVVIEFKPHHDCAYQAWPWNSMTDAEGVK